MPKEFIHFGNLLVGAIGLSGLTSGSYWLVVKERRQRNKLDWIGETTQTPLSNLSKSASSGAWTITMLTFKVFHANLAN